MATTTLDPPATSAPPAPAATAAVDAAVADALIATARQEAATFDPTPRLISLGSNRGGALYLEVKWRLLWLRKEHPEAIIETELRAHHEREQGAVFWARVTIPGGGSATGWGSETAGDFRDYLEKAETKALGRALAALGYGTQFAGDDEGPGAGHGEGRSRATGELRIADAPIYPDRGRATAGGGAGAGADGGAPPRVQNEQAEPTKPQLGLVAGLVRQQGIGDTRGDGDTASELEQLAFDHAGKWDYRQMTRGEISTFIDKLRRWRREEYGDA